jgi:hypothetical protein
VLVFNEEDEVVGLLKAAADAGREDVDWVGRVGGLVVDIAVGVVGEIGCVSGASGSRRGFELDAFGTNKSKGRRGCGAREAEVSDTSDIKTWHD